jgi:hypothetical protein
VYLSCSLLLKLPSTAGRRLPADKESPLWDKHNVR